MEKIAWAPDPAASNKSLMLRGSWVLRLVLKWLVPGLLFFLLCRCTKKSLVQASSCSCPLLGEVWADRCGNEPGLQRLGSAMVSVESR